MPSASISIKYKPVRIGFLVKEESLEDIVKSAGINSMLWGGIYNPIIPIKKDENIFAEQLMNLFSVDVLYATSESSEINAFMQKYCLLRDPGHYAEKIFYEDGHTRKQIPGYLDILNIIDYFWDKEFKHKPKSFKSSFSLINWQENDPLSNVFAVQFGFFPKKTELNLKYDYEKNFLDGLYAKEETISPKQAIDVNFFKSISPIRATSAELNVYTAGIGCNGNGIYLGRSNNFSDLVSYWNLRATGISLVYVAKDALDRCASFGQTCLDELNKLPNSHPNIDDLLTIYHRFEQEEIVKELGQQFTSEKQFGWSRVDEVSWNGLNVQPNYPIFGWEQSSGDIEKSYDRYTVSVKLPAKTFLVNPDSDADFQQMGVVVDAYGEHGYPGHTLKPPYIRDLNEFYSRKIAIDPWTLRIGKEGITLLIKASDNSLHLYPLSKIALIEKLFNLVGLKASTSQPGLIAKKIIEKIGGVDGGRVFKIKGVRKLLQEKNPNELVTRGEATRTIFENDFDKHKKLYIEARKASHLDSASVFDFLLKKDFFRAGLELECNHCKLKNWQSLKVIDDNWICEYCGGQNQTSLHLRDRGDWKFRKSGLFAKDNNQEGAIPVLLTLLTFYRIHQHSNFYYSTALDINGEGISCESDFCVIHHGRQGKIEIGIGECKSEGGVITEDDCKNMKSVYQKLKNIEEVKVFITFAKTADLFTSDEIKLFKKLKEERVPVILFTNRELELYHPYWLEDGKTESDIPLKFTHSLSDLCRNSIARYLS